MPRCQLLDILFYFDVLMHRNHMFPKTSCCSTRSLVQPVELNRFVKVCSLLQVCVFGVVCTVCVCYKHWDCEQLTSHKFYTWPCPGKAFWNAPTPCFSLFAAPTRYHSTHLQLLVLDHFLLSCHQQHLLYLEKQLDSHDSTTSTQIDLV